MTACQKNVTPESIPSPSINAIANTNSSEYPAIVFEDAPAMMVLDIYRKLTDAQMDMKLPPEALNAPITVKSEPKIEPLAAARLIEIALREQAGIVVTRVDEKNLKVTFDSAVKRKQANRISP